MYTHREERNVESICYDEAHIQKVLAEIKKNFDDCFSRFIETQAGAGISGESFSQLQNKFGVQKVHKTSVVDGTANYKAIIASSVVEFEKDRQDYLNIFDAESLEEYEEDASTFKSKVLHDLCPVIRKTIANRQAKELDKYRYDFSISDADGLLAVVTRLSEFAEDYDNNIYDESSFEAAQSYKDFKFSLLDSEDYTYFGVIGGGIKTMMLYKVNPKIFPSRSRNALWALWYLTGKKSFGCKMDSEFLMINIKKITTQQNYFYPYELFNFYAFEIYKLLRDKAKEMNVYIDPNYRYVIVDSFLDFIAGEHESDISVLTSQVKDDGGYSYA